MITGSKRKAESNDRAPKRRKKVPETENQIMLNDLQFDHSEDLLTMHFANFNMSDNKNAFNLNQEDNSLWQSQIRKYFPSLEFTQTDEFNHNPHHLLFQAYYQCKLDVTSNPLFAVEYMPPLPYIFVALSGNFKKIAEAELGDEYQEILYIVAASNGFFSTTHQLTPEGIVRALYIAATYNNSLGVNTLITQFSEMPVECKTMALNYAVTKGHVATVKTILDLCPDIANEDKNACLQHATTNDYQDVALELITHLPVDIELIGDFFNYLVLQNHLDGMIKILTHFPNISPHDKGRALCLAAKEGNVEIIKILLTHPACKDMLPISQGQACRVAIEHGSLSAVQIFIDYLCSNNNHDYVCRSLVGLVRTLYGDQDIDSIHSSISEACSNDSETDFMKGLFSNSIFLDSNANAVSCDILNTVAELILSKCLASNMFLEEMMRAVASCNDNRPKGRALCLAAKQGHVDSINLLLGHFAFANLPEKSKGEACRVAIEHGNLSSVHIFLQYLISKYDSRYTDSILNNLIRNLHGDKDIDNIHSIISAICTNNNEIDFMNGLFSDGDFCDDNGKSVSDDTLLQVVKIIESHLELSQIYVEELNLTFTPLRDNMPNINGQINDANLNGNESERKPQFFNRHL